MHIDINREEIVSIKTTELQQLLEASGDANIEMPADALHISDNTVHMKASDLKKLFEQSFNNIGAVPQTPWNIHDSAAKYRDSLKQKELQNLFSSNGFSAPTVPENPWKITKQSALHQQKMNDLKELLTRTRFNDKVPENKWNIRGSSLRFGKPEAADEADELTAPIVKTPLSEVVAGSAHLTREQQTYLQQILENHGLMPHLQTPDEKDKWNIRESGEKFRKIKMQKIRVQLIKRIYHP